jgi:hypothetical protein
MRETTFKLREGSEFPVRFAGHEVTYNVPQTLDEIRALLAPEANEEEVIVGFFNGQGYNLTVQKAIKAYLATDEAAKLDVGEALSAAVTKATEGQLGAPRVKGEGKGTKVARAEAKAEGATEGALAMYRAMPAKLRAQLREQVIETSKGAITADMLDSIDAEG